MRKVILPLAFVATSTLVACSFQMGSGRNNPQTPPPNQPAAQPGQPQPAAQPVNTKPTKTFGRRAPGQPSGPTPTPTNSGTTPAPTPTAPPSGIPVVTGSTIFGAGTPVTPGWKGNLYALPAGATKLPALAGMQPAGLLFTTSLQVTPQAFTTGFPGTTVPTTNFAIRYEAPLVVTAEADFDFRLVADDGANLLIDNTLIIDNDGAKPAPAEKKGPVHLVAGTHLITVDYMQTTNAVALQLFCNKAGAAEAPCPLSL